MAHDYAKKSRSPAKKTSTQRKSRTNSKASTTAVPGWVWLFVGTAIGAFIMFLVRLADIDPNAASEAAPAKPAVQQTAAKSQSTVNTKTNTREAQTREPKTAPKPKTQANSPAAELQKPRFDFYKMLKENEVPVVEATETTAQPPATPRVFVLQVASFRQLSDAEELRVKLILLGLDARVETATVRNGERWHRVLVGPFENRSMLSKARNRLISNGHQALVLEVKD